MGCLLPHDGWAGIEEVIRDHGRIMRIHFVKPIFYSATVDAELDKFLKDLLIV